jgi:hypothetical protein
MRSMQGSLARSRSKGNGAMGHSPITLKFGPASPRVDLRSACGQNIAQTTATRGPAVFLLGHHRKGSERI